MQHFERIWFPLSRSLPNTLYEILLKQIKRYLIRWWSLIFGYLERHISLLSAIQNFHSKKASVLNSLPNITHHLYNDLKVRWISLLPYFARDFPYIYFLLSCVGFCAQHSLTEHVSIHQFSGISQIYHRYYHKHVYSFKLGNT